jgi:hypothetical protein
MKYLKLKLKLIYDRQSPVSLGVRHPSGTRDQFFFLLEIFFRQLRIYYYIAPSLETGRVCNLLYCFWALPEQSLLGRSPAEPTAIFYCLIWDSPNLEGQVPVFISPQEQGGPVIPRALGSLFVASYDSQGLRWRYSTPPHLYVKLDAQWWPHRCRHMWVLIKSCNLYYQSVCRLLWLLLK